MVEIAYGYFLGVEEGDKNDLKLVVVRDVQLNRFT